MQHVNLSSLDRFRCSEAFDEFYTSLTTEGRSVHNITTYQHDNTVHRYHFQPVHNGRAYVEENASESAPTVHLCPKCSEDNEDKLKRMRHCRYIDHDIGVPYHMNPHFLCNLPLKIGKLSTLNELALARVLTCVTIVKLYTAGATPQQAGYSIRNHVFCVRSDGPEVIAAHLASDQWSPDLADEEMANENHLVNDGCLEALVVYFFGDGAAYTAIKSANMVAAVTIDVDSSARHLKYIVEAGTNPAYLALQNKLPGTHESLAKMLERPLLMLQKKAEAAVILCGSEITSVVERTLPHQGDGYSTLTRDAVATTDTKRTLQAVHKLTSEVQEDKDGSALHADVTNELVRDMSETHLIYGGAFYFYLHFPLGVPTTQQQAFPQWRIAQLLQCNNAEIEADPRFMGYVTGVQRRRQANQVSKLEIRPDRDGVGAFVKVTSAKSFMPTLQRHMANPDSEEASAFLNTLRPLLQKTKPKLDWSPGQKQNFKPRLFAMVRRC